jgi:hypothetical protein
MAKLSITDNQFEQILDAMDSGLDSAFLEGTSAPSYPTALPPLTAYDSLSGAQQLLARQVFESLVAAIISTLRIDKPLPAVKLTGTVALAKLTPGGTNGSLEVTDGILTSYTAPT